MSETERDQLTALTMRRKTAHALALRARIVLACADGTDNKAVAAKLRVTQQTVSKWRGRYVTNRLDGLLESASWLNQPERWFATLTEQYIRRGTHRSTRQLEEAIRHYLDVYNAEPRPFVWSKSADDILASLERFCTRVQKVSGRTP
ncbi:hypothetical protein LIG30_0009 [Burkholderia sp. lig30]|nr:hypothetical protein LIG30_0009 [Burkholderia sp. lig30]